MPVKLTLNGPNIVQYKYTFNITNLKCLSLVYTHNKINIAYYKIILIVNLL